jgi:hypothetical protein
VPIAHCRKGYSYLVASWAMLIPAYAHGFSTIAVVRCSTKETQSQLSGESHQRGTRHVLLTSVRWTLTRPQVDN